MNRKAIQILLAQWTSTFGTHFHQLALPLLIYQRTGAVQDFAFSMLAETLPWVLFSPIAIRHLKSFNVKRVLVTADLLRLIFCLVIALVPLPTANLLLLMVLMGSANSIYGAMRATIIREIVPQADLSRYLSVSLGGNDVLAISAPAIGALLLSAGLNSQYLMLIDGASYLISALLIAQLRFIAPPKRAESKQNSMPFFAIIKYVSRHKTMGWVLWSECLRSSAEAIFVPLLLVVFVQVLQLSENDYATSRFFFSAASIAGAFAYGKYCSKKSVFVNHLISSLVIFIALLLLPLSSKHWAFVFSFATGFGMALRQLLAENLFFTEPRKEMQAELVTTINAIVSAAYIVGYSIAGVVVGLDHQMRLFSISAIVLACGIPLSLYMQRKQKLQTREVICG